MDSKKGNVNGEAFLQTLAAGIEQAIKFASHQGSLWVSKKDLKESNKGTGIIPKRYPVGIPRDSKQESIAIPTSRDSQSGTYGF